MSNQGFILSSSQIIRQNVTQLIFQGRLSDGKRFHWTVTRPGLVFFIDRDQDWLPPGAFRKNVELKSLRGKPVDALYFWIGTRSLLPWPYLHNTTHECLVVSTTPLSLCRPTDVCLTYFNRPLPTDGIASWSHHCSPKFVQHVWTVFETV
jgi:hypothetical protein